MSWLDPDRLAALYGKKPLKKADSNLHSTAESKEIPPQEPPKQKKKALKKAEKAEKKARKKHEKQVRKLAKEALKATEPLQRQKPGKKADCCLKYKKGRQCKDCPLDRIKL
jgi:hypothetical protein